VSAHFILGRRLPSELPDYAIHMSSRLSNLYCTFVDKNRKIIIYADVRNMQSSEGSWGLFESSLKVAVNYADLMEREGRKFNLVVSNLGIIETI
jgi:hypothetical protein